MRAAQLGNYFIGGCAASSLLGWIASLHPMAQKAIAFLLAGTSIIWGLSWLLDYSLSKLLKIEVHALQAYLMASAAMLVVGLGIWLAA
jgi:hypothetical protein